VSSDVGAKKNQVFNCDLFNFKIKHLSIQLVDNSKENILIGFTTFSEERFLIVGRLSSFWSLRFGIDGF
jgi:hypothetical protein